jgi:hypothetical protein
VPLRQPYPELNEILTSIGVAGARVAAIDGALASCDVVGGTAPRWVAEALAAARRRLG